MEETTRLVLDRLLEHLDGEVSEDPKLIGRALYDQNLAIIHHFYGAAEGRGQILRKVAENYFCLIKFLIWPLKGTDYKTFAYPDFDAGFCLNQPLLNKLIELLPEWKQAPNFQIDIKHELMKFIDDKLSLKMTPSKNFCGGNWHREQKKCFTFSGKGNLLFTVGFWSLLDHITFVERGFERRVQSWFIRGRFFEYRLQFLTVWGG